MAFEAMQPRLGHPQCVLKPASRYLCPQESQNISAGSPTRPTHILPLPSGVRIVSEASRLPALQGIHHSIDVVLLPNVTFPQNASEYTSILQTAQTPRSVRSI